MRGNAARRTDLLLAVGLFLGVLLVNQWLFASAFGLTYDEPVYQAVGARHVGWLGRVLHGDTEAFSRAGFEAGWGNYGSRPTEADWHPPIAKVWEELWRRLPSPFGPFAQFRLGASLLFALTAAALFLWLRSLAGRTAALAAALAWVTLPNAVAHGNLAALDGPVTALSVLALWQAQRVMTRPTWRGGAWFGLWLALSMGAKFNGVLTLPAVLIVAAGRRREALKPLILGACVVAPLVFFLTWPWLWYDGFTHLRQVIAFHGRHSYIATQYFGRIYIDPPPPWHEPLVLLVLTSPLATLLTAVLGAARKPSRAPEWGVADTVWLLLAALVCHVLPFALPHAAKYNGVRLFLPALAILAALSGLGVGRLVALVRARLKLDAEHGRLAAVALAAGIYLPALVGLLEVYPYPMAYYNALAGGAAGAERRGLEVSYWGDSFRGLCGWLNANAPRGAEVYLHPPGAIAMVQMYKGAGLLRDDLKLVSGEAAAHEASLFVFQNRPSEWDALGFELRELDAPLFELRAGGARVGFIWAGPH